MKDYHDEILPEKAHLYFKENMLKAIHEDIRHQIITKEVKHLAIGQGLFIYEEQDSKDRGRFHLSIHAQWKYNQEEKKFDIFEIVKYHLYSGDMPNEILDEMNQLKAAGEPEWKTYNEET